MDFWKSVDTWFLVVAIVILIALLGGLVTIVAWGVQFILSGIKKSIEDLGATFERAVIKFDRFFDDLYEHKGHHETRIVVIEDRLGISPTAPIRHGGGRRDYDPEESQP